ncbi:putative hydroxymethylpyrimidine transport system ATP-binding protein [Desulfonispora thiosulfatigenes DSM 11270]|uniref:Putative hydroxymethylpyrimidine transport system ATP-binding protein n=1 Tax=Desulfonispora thiosulfatigenes DSM 11270 TaxID=656914 RepID=A0A1W1ULF5_DESTI|nr:ABC transporter ATP-binding protein [Desulfonispora thiosulfatigenes]SMB81641.1 putative hydroxymethylpyrimidine transport system ATP-binding protein [Desulfonispora thiosulfatigenes DSM 11270]
MELNVDKIHYSYQENKEPVFENISFKVEKSEFIALVGPSGCGKTTLLHILGGLLEPTKGQVLLNGSNTDRMGKISLMPQEDLLLPWRTILENGVLPLEIKGIKKEEARNRVKELIKEFGLEGYENAYPHHLSGGMRQRVAFLRNILTGNKVILFDEPFSALDALTRFKMQKWLLKMWQKFKPTIIFITHDVEEAIFLSQRIFLLGKIPNRNIKEFIVPFKYPRDNDLLGYPKFTEIRQAILKGLEGLEE